MSQQRHFLIDTDTASDDAIALIMAARYPNVQIEAITVVAGNIGAVQATQNALYTLELCDKTAIPVYCGATRPMLRPLEKADFVHGKDGMGDIGLEVQNRQAQTGNAIDAIVDTINAFPNEIELITLGPLTNVAIALLKNPEIADKVKQCIVMGGVGYGVGNITNVSEYNIWVDPEAAKIVFESGMNIKMVGWDIALKHAFLSPAKMQEMYAIDTKLARFSMDIQKQKVVFNKKVNGVDGIHLADPIAMAIALDETVATKTIRCHVDVICGEGSTRGQTVVDHNGLCTNKTQVDVVLEASTEGFQEMMKNTLLDN